MVPRGFSAGNPLSARSAKGILVTAEGGASHPRIVPLPLTATWKQKGRARSWDHVGESAGAQCLLPHTCAKCLLKI